MEMNKEKELDDLIRKAIIEVGLEQPEPQLKSGIMKAISAQYSSTVYKALIPGRAWGVMALVLMLFAAFVWFNPLGLNKMGVDLFSRLIPSMSWAVSSVVLYGVVVLGVMVGIQVYLLKRRIDHTYE